MKRIFISAFTLASVFSLAQGLILQSLKPPLMLLQKPMPLPNRREF